MRQSAGLIGGIRVSPRSCADDQSKANLAHMRELFIIATPPGISMHDHIIVRQERACQPQGLKLI